MDNRIFDIYKNRLSKLGKEFGQIRFICIEYLCSFPKIDPYTMAKSLLSDGFKIVFDDSSISRQENEKKHRKVYTN